MARQYQIEEAYVYEATEYEYQVASIYFNETQAVVVTAIRDIIGLGVIPFSR